MTTDILALARDVERAPLVHLKLSAADALAAAVLALECPRHPDAGIGCRTCALLELAASGGRVGGKRRSRAGERPKDSA